MTFRRILYCAQRPVYSLRLIAYKFDEIRHCGEPWVSRSAVRFCDANLKRDQIGLEWGSGHSTKWYAARLRKLLSVEFSPVWHAKVLKEIKGQDNVECRFVPL
jgi:hypothetical protein